jgi:hypothetical protein
MEEEKIKKYAELRMEIENKIKDLSVELHLQQSIISAIDEVLNQRTFVKQPTMPMPLHLQSTTIEPAMKPKLSGDKIVFPNHYADLLTVTENEDYIIIKPQNFIRNKQDFKEISQIIKDYGGEYVSANRDTHWRIKR